MNVLFLLSCLEPAGSETYCVSLAKAWGPRHSVFWISDRLHYGQEYFSLPISRKAFPGGLINTWKVARFVRRNHIDIIHSHSRRAHWVAAQVSFLTKVPHVATIHQPPPVHFFSRLFPCLGRYTIAIDEAVRDHLVRHFGRSLKASVIIRNGIDLNQFKPLPVWKPGRERKIVLLGRLTGGRWRSFQFFLDVLKRVGAKLPKTQFQIAGAVPDELRPETDRRIEAANRMIAPSRVEALGFVNNLTGLLQDSNGVVAGGRSAMEALACGKPVLILGEGGVLGLFGPATLEDALHTNFGDHQDPLEFFPAKLELGLREILDEGMVKTDIARWGRLQVEKNFDARQVSQEVESIYEKLVKRT